MKRLIGFVLMILFAATPSLAAEVKIGVVDLQKAIASSKAGLESKAKMEVEIKAFEKKAEANYKELEKLRDELSNPSEIFKDEARAAKEKEFKQKSREYQLYETDHKEELRQLDSKLYNQLIQTFFLVAQEVAKQEGYDFVFERSSIVYVADAADLTDKLVAAADSKLAKKKDK
ncbi:MAG: OmpH family outer membrane protein [Candidatus Zixiibacteriota bacterium]|nr:MAG: OmpH family outer membrane protein [candidate division Zixibacteria bacterium]